MTVRLYQSTDGDAPKLSGEPARLVQVLEACLVTGYGEKPGLGWQIDRLADQTRAALKSTDPAATGCWLYLDDDGQAFNAQFAKGLGIEPDGWDGFDGAGEPQISGALFPMAAQAPAGAPWAKSSTEDAAAVPWVLVADERMFYLFLDPTRQWDDSDPNTVGGVAHAFGDLESYVPGDAFACIHGSSWDDTPDIGPNFSGNDWALFRFDTNCTARNALGTSGAKPGRGAALSQTTLSRGGGAPYPIQGTVSGALLHEVYWREDDGNLRGRMPGLYSYYHSPPPFDHGHIETLPDGRQLLGVEYRFFRQSDGPALAVVDVTGPWR